MRILIVDPEDTLRQSVGAALEAAGYEVRLRREPEAALVEAQASAVEALLLDLGAGEAGVLGFLRRYRSGGGSGIVIVTGGETTTALAATALREGADGFVRKPPVPDELLLALRQAEERERLRQEVARLRAT